MECQNCELKQRQFYCENCLKQHLLSLRAQINHLASERDGQITSAQRSLTDMEAARLRRADLKGNEERVREIWAGLENIRKTNEKSRERIRSLREALSTRRRTLAIASSTFHYSHPSPSPSPSTSPSHPLHSPQGRPNPNRRPSSSTSISQQSTPSPIARTRPNYPFPPTATPHVARASTISPQAMRLSPSTPPSTHPYFNRSTTTPIAVSTAESGDPVLSRQIEQAAYQLSVLSDTIARARSGLVQELVEVFSIAEVGGRPPIGGKAGTKGEWTIGGLVLPVPGDIRRYPPDHINAVLTHTLHLLSLLAFYLGVKLPFEAVWSRSTTPPSLTGDNTSGLLGVGTPWIGAIRGGENGGWSRWTTKHPLHVSSLPSVAPSSPTAIGPSVSTSASRPRSVSRPIPPARVSSASVLADSHIDDEPTSAHGSSFTTALAMLLYDVCYLAHTQAVDVPLAQAGEVLGNLWAVCCSPELGRKSHATYPFLRAPTPSNFPLDFAQLLQATAANPTRARARGSSGRDQTRRMRDTERAQIVEEEEGWDLIDVDN